MKNRNYIVPINNGKIVYVHSVMNFKEAAIVAQAFMIRQGMTYELDMKNINLETINLTIIFPQQDIKQIGQL